MTQALPIRSKNPDDQSHASDLSSSVVMEPAITEEGSSVAFQVTATVRFLPAHDRRKRRLRKWSFQEAKLSAFESLLFQGYVLLAFQSYNALSFIK